MKETTNIHLKIFDVLHDMSKKIDENINTYKFGTAIDVMEKTTQRPIFLVQGIIRETTECLKF